MIERFMLNEELVEKVGNITGVDYSGMLKVDDIENIIKDLICEYHRKEEELEDKERYCDEYHVSRDIDYYDEYGVSEHDFY